MSMLVTFALKAFQGCFFGVSRVAALFLETNPVSSADIAVDVIAVVLYTLLLPPLIPMQ